ncbi:nucleotidyltransferase domain-containing protein [Methylococcus sp. ANG]|uniref:nucleotidyltransferase domain-containing protein n=1 Tax=Methylococcus sp. ANG TaxID=3231903 RepID=UPI00345B16B8
MPYGLRDSDLALIVDAIEAFPEIERVLLFGSRAEGNFKTGSDVDLAIQGKAVGHESAVRLAGVLNEEKPLPYYFDVLDYAAITEPGLLEHIDRVGIVIYERPAQSAHA